LSVEDFAVQPVKALGGLCTFLERSEVPQGSSPNCADVEFRPKALYSRPGLGLRFTDDSAFGGLKSFYGIDRVRRLVILESNGKIAVETPEGTISQIQHLYTNGLLKAIYAFGRLWMCVSGVAGTSATGMPLVRPLDFPMFYDPIPSPSGPFMVAPANASAPPIAGTAADTAGAGLITAGKHYFFYTFEDKYGFITQQSPVGSWTAAGAKGVDFSAILTGPYGLFGSTVRRRLWMTPAFVAGSGVSGFFNIGALVIDDDVSTTLTASFTDATLQASGTPWATENLTLCPPPPAIGVTKYADRLVLWGVYNGVEPRLAQRVEGGGTDILLLGRSQVNFSSIADWTIDVGSAGIVNQATQYASLGTRTGQVLQMDNVSRIHKDYTNLLTSTSQDPQYWLSSGRRYGFLVRADGGFFGATLTIAMIGQTSGTTLATGTLVLPAANPLQSRWAIYEVDGLNDVPANEATIRFDIQSSATLSVDWVRPYLQADKFDGSTVWIGDNLVPMNFDLVKSPLPVAPGDWQEIRCCFEQTGNLYIVKEHSTWITSDNGQDPNTWSIDNVSFQMGTPSVHGVGIGPEFAIIAGREGVYRFDSGGIEKISQEIETTWKGVDWKQGHLLWVTVDATLKVIRVGVPLKSGPAGTCNIVLKCDYTEGWSEGWKAGDTESTQGYRKWTPDNVSTLCGELAEKDDGSSNILMGGSRSSSNNFTDNNFFVGSAPWIQLGTRAATGTYSQAQPMGPYLSGNQYGTKWSFPFSSGTARYAGKDATFVAAGGYFVGSFWAQSPTPGVNVLATIKDPFGLADLPITITPAWRRFVAVFGPSTVSPRTVNDGAMTAGLAVLTSATAAFTAADVGRDVSVAGAAAGGLTLYTTITVFTNATTVTLGATNLSGGNVSGAAVTVGRLEILDLDFGTLTASIAVLLFGGQLQSGQYDRGWTGQNHATGANNTGSGLASGFLSEPVIYDPGSNPPWLTSDWDGVITPTYEFAPFGAPLGRSNFNRIIARIRGSGALQAYYVSPDGSTVALNAGNFPTMTTSPRNDIEMGGAVSDTYVGVRLLTQGRSNWFALKRFGIFSKPHEGAPFRGKS
jgi:hypothetical protein